jgi:hypothetical protein
MYFDARKPSGMIGTAKLAQTEVNKKHDPQLVEI